MDVDAALLGVLQADADAERGGHAHLAAQLAALVARVGGQVAVRVHTQEDHFRAGQLLLRGPHHLGHQVQRGRHPPARLRHHQVLAAHSQRVRLRRQDRDVLQDVISCKKKTIHILLVSSCSNKHQRRLDQKKRSLCSS